MRLNQMELRVQMELTKLNAIKNFSILINVNFNFIFNLIFYILI